MQGNGAQRFSHFGEVYFDLRARNMPSARKCRHSHVTAAAGLCQTNRLWKLLGLSAIGESDALAGLDGGRSASVAEISVIAEDRASRNRRVTGDASIAV
jgi:hypothetical protein